MTNFNIRFIVIEVKIMFALRKYLASITNCMQQACLGLHINFLPERLLKQLTYFLFLENFRDPTPWWSKADGSGLRASIHKALTPGVGFWTLIINIDIWYKSSVDDKKYIEINFKWRWC